MSGMQAYKFKSAAQADHIFDVLLNRRLFCATRQEKMTK